MSTHRVDDVTNEARDERDRTTRSLLREAAQVVDPGTRERLLEEAILVNLPMARALAQRYQRRGVDLEDLVQVAMLGLVKSVRGYCPMREKSFAAYAVPTISGEIKRHFRDRGWMIRPPRSIQELNSALRAVEPDLAQSLGRTPTIHELAEHLGAAASAVNAAREAGRCYETRSLDSPVGDSDQLLGDHVADPDNPFELVDDMLTLRPALESLGARERRLLRLRFVDNLSQQQIGHQLGVSQMQISRLLTAVLRKLRHSLQEQPAA
ncbi:MAG: SigB/SigF/SigG family RNA polymerase sigma factor [Actinomycetota bacterium]